MDAPFREMPPTPPDPYLVAWAELRRRRRMRWLVFFGWAPVAALCASVLHSIAGASFQVVVVPIGLVAAALMLYYGRFACPKCGKSFERRAFYSDPWTQRCLNCGISRGTPKSAEHG